MTVGASISGARRDQLRWVVERLRSWGAWARRDGPRGFGQSSLTMEEVRALPVHAYVPVTDEECERTHEAVRKLPSDLQKLAGDWYVHEFPQSMMARRQRASERHVRRLHDSLLLGIEFCLKNQSVKRPPWDVLLQS